MRSLLVSTIAVALGAGAVPAFADRPGFDPRAVYSVPLGEASQRGPASAPITIVEYSDFLCGFCNRAQAVLEQVERLFPGQIRWVFRHFPLDEESGTLPAEAATAAGFQGAFWPMHDRLFALHGQVDRATVELAARDLGLDMIRFRGDLDGGAARTAVMRDWSAGGALGISGTPTFFVNGRAVHGARGIGTFASVIRDEQARARTVAATKPPNLYEALVANGASRADTSSPTPIKVELERTQVYRVGLGLPGHSEGPSDALVTVVEWSDFECPYCERMSPVLKRLRKERPKDVRIVYRHMPLSIHPDSLAISEVAIVAGKAGRFWQFHDQVFARDTKVPLTRESLIQLAVEAGVAAAEVAAALDDHRYRDLAMTEAAAAGALGATGTPTLFVNGAALPGAVAYEHLLATVDAQLVAARELVARGIPATDVYGVITAGADATETSDPRRLPRPDSGARLEMGPIEREAAVMAACRSGDREEAGQLGGGLAADAAARGVCTDLGVDLPQRTPGARL